MKYLFKILFVFVPLLLSAQRWKPVEPNFDSLFLIVDNPSLKQLDKDSIKTIIKELDKIASLHPEKNILRWRVDYLKTVIYLRDGRPDSCEFVCNKILENLDSVKYSYDWHRVNLRRCGNQSYKMSYVEKYKSLRSTLDYFISIGDSLNQASSLVNLGNLLYSIGWEEKSLETHNRAIEIYEKLGLIDMALKCQINIANCMGSLKGTKEALNILENLKNEPLIRTDTAALIQVLHSICFYGDNTPYLEKASKEVYDIAYKTGRIGELNKAYVNLGASYIMNDKPDSALILYRKALNYAITTDNLEFIIPSLTGLSVAFEKKEQWDSAYFYRLEREKYANELQRENKDEELQLAESRALIQQHEEKMGLLREKSRSQRMALIMCLALVVCIAIGVAYWLWDRRAKAQAKSDMMALQLENQKLQADLMAQRMEQNERELTSNAILLTEHQNTLTRLKESITKESQSGEISKQAERALKSEILAHSGTENRWEYFFIHFNQMHPDFFDNLKAVCPSLTKGETRICAYIRIGMDNKQIAELLSIEASSVKQARYRIRKKLPITTTDSLEDFLNTISPYNGLNLTFT